MTSIFHGKAASNITVITKYHEKMDHDMCDTYTI